MLHKSKQKGQAPTEKHFDLVTCSMNKQSKQREIETQFFIPFPESALRPPRLSSSKSCN